ncbi:MAG: glucose-1-phosphate thymidylyltransferase RfbA [Rickettsiales bacterium]
MKAVLLAGGSGSRLYPLSTYVTKQLLPVYDKPLIYYPLSTLMTLGIRDILIITNNNDLENIKALLGNGRCYGINISYETQDRPRGIAHGLIIAKEFLEGQACCLILGDNIFYGADIYNNKENNKFKDMVNNLQEGAYTVGYRVADSERYGVLEFGPNQEIISIEEKPKIPKSNWVSTGIYLFDNKAPLIAESLSPSHRGELEITDVLNHYLENKRLKYFLLGRGTAWLDAGTPEALIEASQFVYNVEKRQGIKISCLEEIAFKKGFISLNEFLNIINKIPKNCEYRKYLQKIFQENKESKI